MNEAVHLSKEDFDLDRRTIFLGVTKTNKGDTAPIPDPFIPELTHYLSTKENGRLMPKCNPQIVRYWIVKLGKLLDIPAWTTPQSITGEKTQTHIFRKSIAKDMLYGTHGGKVPLNLVMETLRHKDLVQTTGYLKANLNDVLDFWESNKTSLITR